LAISDSAPDSPQTVALSGTGSLPLTISPATLSFGTVPWATAVAAKTVSLTNNESTTLSSLQRERQLLYQFERKPHAGASLASKAKCNIAVTFTPTAKGSINGRSTITDTAGFSRNWWDSPEPASGGATAPLYLHSHHVELRHSGCGHYERWEILTVKKQQREFLDATTIATYREILPPPGADRPLCG